MDQREKKRKKKIDRKSNDRVTRQRQVFPGLCVPNQPRESCRKHVYGFNKEYRAKKKNNTDDTAEEASPRHIFAPPLKGTMGDLILHAANLRSNIPDHLHCGTYVLQLFFPSQFCIYPLQGWYPCLTLNVCIGELSYEEECLSATTDWTHESAGGIQSTDGIPVSYL